MFEGLVLAAAIMTAMGFVVAAGIPRNWEDRIETRHSQQVLTMQGYAIRATLLILVAVGFRVWG